ncbi:MAG: glycosyltransferase family 2 protein [Flavobacterium sp.]|nr:MAG: glycosyltransferase family 2 protein [Flavobacterium sp.]
MHPIKVSVIIPLYNAEKFIEETIQSVINQTCKNIEIIIIDDGSTDSSYSVAQNYVGDFITVVKQENAGASAARNRGLRLAKGEYIQFLDADDLLSATKIEEQIKSLHQLSNYVAVCNTIHFTEKIDLAQLTPNRYEKSFLMNSNNPADFLVKLWGGYSKYGSMVSIHAWLTPKKIIEASGPWNEALSYDDDGEFFARVLLRSDGIAYNDNVFSYYRKQSSSTLSDLDSNERLTSMLDSVLSKQNQLLKKKSDYNAQLALYKMLTGVALKCLPKNIKLYRTAIKARPKIDAKNYQPSVGGPITQRLAEIFGWKAIRILQYYLRLKK